MAASLRQLNKCKSMPWWLLPTNLIHEDNQWSRWLIWNSGITSRNLTSIQKSNKTLNNLGEPQEQRARQRYLFLWNKACQAAHFPWRSLQSRVFVTHIPCKNKKFKGEVKNVLFLINKQIKYWSRSLPLWSQQELEGRIHPVYELLRDE